MRSFSKFVVTGHP